MCFHADTMARFHLLRDPYFPKQGNNGWLEEEPEEEPEEEHDEEREEEPEMEIEDRPVEPAIDVKEEGHNADSDDDSDTESVFINPPYPVRVPGHRMGPSGPTPP